MNHHIRIFIIAPLTSSGHAYPTRVPCTFHRVRGFVVLDQLRTVDQERLVRRLGALRGDTLPRVLAVLREMFAD